MTEEQWLTSRDPVAMAEFLRNATVEWKTRWVGWVTRHQFRVSDRKWILFACGCCRRIEDLLGQELRSCLAAVERSADEVVAKGEVEHAFQAAQLSAVGMFQGGKGNFFTTMLAAAAVVMLRGAGAGQVAQLLGAVARARATAAHPPRGGTLSALFLDPGVIPGEAIDAAAEERAHQADLLRDAIGNPFVPSRVEPEWLHPELGVVAIAREIYDERAFDRLPILGDALEDAGCADAAMLDHCRKPGPHARGCWLVDQILGNV
jgi:hypothetical protein